MLNTVKMYDPEMKIDESKKSPSLILELLASEDLSVNQLTERIGRPLKSVRMAVYRLEKDKAIKKTGEFLRRANIYTLTNPHKHNGELIGHLKFLMDFFQRNGPVIQRSDKDYIIKNKDVFKEISNILKKEGEADGG